jgi:hypothetical protein
MKSLALFFILYIAASTSAFTVQSSQARFGTALSAEPLFKRITGLDLFAPNPEINTYGARKNKNVRRDFFENYEYRATSSLQLNHSPRIAFSFLYCSLP